MLYFIQTTRFIPIDYKKYGFKFIDNNTILLEKDGSIWKSTKLYDLGWGRENGFYRTPIPKKEELFLMVFPKKIKNNFEERFKQFEKACNIMTTKNYHYLISFPQGTFLKSLLVFRVS